jgi:ATP-dependent Lhr-like helicase
LVTHRKLELYTFAGSKVNRTLNFILRTAAIQTQFDDMESVFDISLSNEDFLKEWSEAKKAFTDIDFHIENLILENPGVMDFSKWIIYLPSELQVKLMKEKYFDLQGAWKFMEDIAFIANV